MQHRNSRALQADALIWYHTVDLGGGVVTQGLYDHRPYLDKYGFPENLSGKRVLDVGAASGFFSFEFERRGGTVVATDLPRWMDHDFAPKYEPDLEPAVAASYLKDPFLVAREARGSKVERREINVYDLSPETVGVFDLVFCGSVLLHLTDPVRALWRLRSVTKKGEGRGEEKGDGGERGAGGAGGAGGEAIIATAIHDDGSDEPRALFVGNDKAFTWWLPNRSGLEAIVRSAGFGTVEWVSQFRLDFADGKPGHLHGVVKARP
jgi:tRNA (mo5U34)-methyltransferase